MSAEAIHWTLWSGYDQLAGCPVCGRYFGVKVDGRLRYHGPNNRRCPGSLALPPESPSPDVSADLAFGPPPSPVGDTGKGEGQ